MEEKPSAEEQVNGKIQELAREIAALGAKHPVAADPLTLTPSQVAAIKRAVVSTGSERLRNFGPVTEKLGNRFSESDFLAGAATVIHAITGDMGQVPAIWILGGPMVGRSIVDPDGQTERAWRERNRRRGRRA